MRMTVTLDDDLHKQLKAIAKARGITLSAAVNEAARDGFAADRHQQRSNGSPESAEVDSPEGG